MKRVKIIFTNGSTMLCDADDYSYYTDSKILTLMKGKVTVGRLNLNNVSGVLVVDVGQ